MKANYDAISQDWDRNRKTLPAKDNALFEYFIESLPPEANILDLGCGTGVPIAQLLANQGFKITGIDRSAKLIQKAQGYVPTASFHQAEIEDYKIEKTYEGIVLWDVIFHLPRALHKPIIERIYDSLTPQGLLILSSGGSEENLPPFTDFMFGIEFFYDAYSVKTLIRSCEEIGFKVEKNEFVNKPDGDRDKGRIGVVLSKAS
jgi:2-polyprenyl-3-methyl-5-hydroxy-6-metoxy-1,4-benzoquinol methylase